MAAIPATGSSAIGDYTRAVEARQGLKTALACLQVARAEVSVALTEKHDTTKAITKAVQQTRIAAEKLDYIVRALGRTL